MATDDPVVLADDGKQGSLVAENAEGQVTIQFGERRFVVPRALLVVQAGGSYRLPYKVADLPEQEIIPLVGEKLEVRKREQTTSVIINKVVTERQETVQVPLEATEVEVNRVEIGRVVESPPDIRTEGNTTIIPILTERVVITKELVLEAEVHVSKKRVTDVFEKTLSLKQEEVEVTREGEATYVDES